MWHVLRRGTDDPQFPLSEWFWSQTVTRKAFFHTAMEEFWLAIDADRWDIILEHIQIGAYGPSYADVTKEVGKALTDFRLVLERHDLLDFVPPMSDEELYDGVGQAPTHTVGRYLEAISSSLIIHVPIPKTTARVPFFVKSVDRAVDTSPQLMANLATLILEENISRQRVRDIRKEK